jgi:hypothetical protein
LGLGLPRCEQSAGSSDEMPSFHTGLLSPRLGVVASPFRRDIVYHGCRSSEGSQ